MKALTLPLPHWRLPLLQLLLLTAALVASQWPAWAGMVSLWWRSDTFAHALLVPPIALWLAWRSRARLAPLQPQPWWPGLLPLAAAVLLIALGRLAEVNVLQHFGAVFSLQALVLTLFGLQVGRALAFPLAFLLFAVPFGEFLMPAMMAHTATFTVGALRLVGIPVFQEGLHFVIPSGNWSVVEACSGIRYLFASFMVGTLFAYLNFPRWPQRLGFMLVSLLVPVVANWLRALIIVLLGHFSGNAIATGADHLVYGWVFFGLIMMLMFWIGRWWADRSPPMPEPVASAAPPVSVPPARWALPLASAALLLALGLAVGLLRGQGGTTVPPQWQQGLAPAGWVAQPASPQPAWQPHFVGDSARWQQAWAAPDGGWVLVDVALYPQQRGEAKAISSVNQLVPADDARWATQGAERLGGGVQQSRWGLRGGSSVELHSARRLYWANGGFHGDERLAKLAGLQQLLLGRGDFQAVVVLMTEGSDARTSARLDAFWAQFQAPLNARLQGLAQGAAVTMPAAAP